MRRGLCEIMNVGRVGEGCTDLVFGQVCKGSDRKKGVS